MSEYIEEETQTYGPEVYPAEAPVLVEVKESATPSPEYGSCMTWTIGQAGVNQPTQILQRRRHRTTGAVSIVTLTGATAVVFNSKLDPLQGANPQGATFTAVGTRVLEWENQQPLYAIAIGGSATVTVIDEAYADR